MSSPMSSPAGADDAIPLRSDASFLLRPGECTGPPIAHSAPRTLWHAWRTRILLAALVLAVAAASITGVVALSQAARKSPAAAAGGGGGEPSNLPSDPHARALALMATTPLMDAHNDLPYKIRELAKLNTTAVDLAGSPPGYDTTIPRMRAGRLGAQLWSVYTACDSQFKDAVRQTLEAIDTVTQLAVKYPAAIGLAADAADVRSVFEQGKVASLMGMEGGHQIDSSVMALRQFHALGVRYMTLTHNCNAGPVDDPWAGSCCPSVGPSNAGLNEFGVQVVREMNRMGMMVDLSHTSVQTMHDVLDVSLAPPLFSHSNARALCDVPRNVPDDVLDRVATAPLGGGVVCVTFVPSFLSVNASSASIETVADHIMYIVDRIGEDHVCIGSDFDGVSSLPTGLTSPADYPDLIALLISRGLSDSAVSAILSGNLLRVLAAAESVAAQLQASTHPSYLIPDPFPDTCRNFLN